MRISKYLILLVLASLLIGYIAVKRYNSPPSLIEKLNQLNGADITLISISQGDNQVVLDLLSTEKEVNNQFHIRSNAFRFLVATLNRVQIKKPASDQERRQFISSSDLQLNFRIEIKDDKIWEFSILNAGLQTFILDAKDNCFEIYIPGYQQQVLFDSFLSDMRFWKDLTIISLSVDDILEISSEDESNINEDWDLKKGQSGYVIFKSNEENGQEVKDQTIKQYLSYFASVQSDSLLFDDSVKKQILAQSPWRKLTILSLKGTLTLNCYKKYDSTNGKVIEDLNNLYVWIAEFNELHEIKYINIDPLLKNYSYFIP